MVTLGPLALQVTTAGRCACPKPHHMLLFTDHAASALGDVVFVDLPAVGTTFSAGESFGSVESVKAASDVYAPVSGEVLAVNSVKWKFQFIFPAVS